MKKKKYKVVFDNEEEEDAVFDSWEEAEEYGLRICSESRLGAEILHMSNPGDYEYDEETWEDVDYEIEEIDE